MSPSYLRRMRAWWAARCLAAAERDRADEAATRAYFAGLERDGICIACRGRRAYDDPPWGIVPCPECNATGKAPK